MQLCFQSLSRLNDLIAYMILNTRIVAFAPDCKILPIPLVTNRNTIDELGLDAFISEYIHLIC